MVENQANKKFKAEIKSEVKTGPELDEQIAKQIAYYFSDVNLVFDKFLNQELKKDDKWVKLSVLGTFARLAQLTKDVDRMVRAMKSYKSDDLELDEVGKRVRRITPIPDKEEYQKKLDLRTIHLSGFPDQATFDVLHQFCSQFGEVESLSMRRYSKSKAFKGCILVTFKDEAGLKKIYDEEGLHFKDRELKKELMQSYRTRKAEIAAKRAQKSSKK